jgi:hypothetical protein
MRAANMADLTEFTVHPSVLEICCLNLFIYAIFLFIYILVFLLLSSLLQINRII